MEEAMATRGWPVSDKERSRFRVRRDGYEYLCEIVWLPKKPGGFVFARITRDGRVVDLMPGV